MDSEKRPFLIVDDDDSYRGVLARSLERKGFAANTAATPEEALERCREQVPECILISTCPANPD